MTNCILCDSPTSVIFDKQFQLNYYQCSNCDLIFQDPNSIVSKQEELDCYNLHENSIEDTGYVNMFEKFLGTAVDNFIKPPAKALDFGCGPGPVLVELLERRGFQTCGYDKFYAKKTTLFDESFDLITSTEVFEHFDNPEQTISEIVSLLKPSGILAIMTCFHKSDTEHFLNWWYRRESTHIAFYNFKTFEYIAEKWNLKLLFCDNNRAITLRKL